MLIRSCFDWMPTRKTTTITTTAERRRLRMRIQRRHYVAHLNRRNRMRRRNITTTETKTKKFGIKSYPLSNCINFYGALVCDWFAEKNNWIESFTETLKVIAHNLWHTHSYIDWFDTTFDQNKDDIIPAWLHRFSFSVAFVILSKFQIKLFIYFLCVFFIVSSMLPSVLTIAESVTLSK